MSLRHYIKLIWESPATEDKNLLRHLRSFHSKLESNGFQVDRNHKFSEGIFSTPVIFRATSKLFGSQGCTDDKTWLDFSSIFFKICRFRSSMSAFAVSFHSTRSDARVRFDQGGKRPTYKRPGLTVARFFSTNHDSLPRIATNEIASFWIDHRSRQLAFFMQRRRKGGAKGRLSRYVEIFWNKKCFLLLYKTNRFHVAVRLIQ